MLGKRFDPPRATPRKQNENGPGVVASAEIVTSTDVMGVPAVSAAMQGS